jgi:hypothetical protein
VAIRPAGTDVGLEHPPKPESTVCPGDSVFVIGEYDDLLGLLQPT